MSTISELFDKDPLELTSEDMREHIAYFRELRLKYKQGDKTAGNPKNTKPKEKIALDNLGELDLNTEG